jgi:hypothetical protein
MRADFRISRGTIPLHIELRARPTGTQAGQRFSDHIRFAAPLSFGLAVPGEEGETTLHAIRVDALWAKIRTLKFACRERKQLPVAQRGDACDHAGVFCLGMWAGSRTMLSGWMGFDDTKSVLKGDFPTLLIFG